MYPFIKYMLFLHFQHILSVSLTCLVVAAELGPNRYGPQESKKQFSQSLVVTVVVNPVLRLGGHAGS